MHTSSSDNGPQALLLELCRRRATEPLAPALVGQLDDGAAGQRFLELAGRHRVLGLSLSALEHSLDLTRADWGVKFQDVLRQLRRRAATFEFLRDRIVKSFNDAGVRSVVLKGAAMAGTLYPEPVERDLLDLDLLVSRSDLHRGLRILGSMGYTGPPTAELLDAYLRYHFHLPMRHSHLPLIEIHWGLAKAEWLFELDPQSVFRLSVTLERPGGRTSLVPCTEHMLLHLVLQNLQEGFSRLARFVDIDRILAGKPLDWDRLVATARAGNLGTATAFSLRLAQQLLDAPVPESVQHELEPGRLTRFHLAATHPRSSLLEQRFERSISAAYLLHFWLLRGGWNRMVFLFRSLLPTIIMMPTRKSGPGVFRRIWRLGKVAVQQLALSIEATASQITSRGRAQMRFWSSQARSSERL